MLDLHTLERTINWLEARKMKIKMTTKLLPIDIAKENLITELIQELASKTRDIRTVVEAG